MRTLMENPIENNRVGLYRFLAEKGFSQIDRIAPEVRSSYDGDDSSQDFGFANDSSPATTINVDLDAKKISAFEQAYKFEEMGIPQWLGVDLCAFYVAIMEQESFIRYPDAEEKTNTEQYKEFIAKIARSMYIREKSWESIEKDIKLSFLSNILSGLEEGNLQCDRQDEIIANIKKALKIIRRETGYNGDLLDVLGYYLTSLDDPDPEVPIKLKLSALGEDSESNTVKINELIIWAVFWDFKAKFKNRIPEDLFMPPPLEFLQNPIVQQIYIESIRAEPDIY